MKGSAKVQLDIKHKSEELQQSLKELYAWEEEMAKKEEVKALKEQQVPENPPVRSKMKKNRSKTKNVEKVQEEQVSNDNMKMENGKRNFWIVYCLLDYAY